jgi:hypothetical protein
MRIIDYELSEKDKELIKEYSIFEDDLLVTCEDIYQDSVALLNVGYEHVYKHLVPFKILYEEAARMYVAGEEERWDAAVSKLFRCRRDIVELSQGNFFKSLFHSTELTYEDKVKVLLEGIKVSMKKLLEDGSSSSGSLPTPYSMLGDIMSCLMPATKKICPGEIQAGDGFSRDGAEGCEKLKESQVIRDALSKLVQVVYDEGKFNIFKLAKNFVLSLSQKDGSDLRDVWVGNTFAFRKMRKYSDIRYVQKKDLALPGEVFDSKFIKKSFIIAQPRERFEKSQLVYVLADCSGSMSGYGTREMFMKAILLSLGRDALERECQFYFRWFNHDVREVYKMTGWSQWSAFAREVLEMNMGGGTNIHNALAYAGDDIRKSKEIKDETEIIVITDGTESVHKDEIAERLKGVTRAYAVLLERVNKEIFREYEKAFTAVLMAQTGTVEEAMQAGLKFVEDIY